MKRSAFGIALCSAIALTCMLAPGNTSATVLCDENKAKCTFYYGVGTIIQASLPAMTTTVIETEIAKVTCLENRIKLKTTSAGGAGLSVTARTSELVFNQCTVPDGMGGTESCTVKAANLGAAEGEQWASTFSGKGGSGELLFSFSELGTPGVSVLCKEKVEKINCTLTEIMNVTVTGGSEGSATISGSPKLKGSGSKCPATESTWKFKLAVSEPANFFLVAE